MLCNKCNVELTSDNWHSSAYKYNSYTCKSCVSKRSSKYYQANRERYSKRNKLYRETHKGYNKEYQAQYYLKNKDTRLKEYWQRNSERTRRQNRAYYLEHKNKLNEWNRNYNQEIKKEVLSHYSSSTIKCLSCDESDIRTLTIDHINNDGKEDRKNRGGGSKFYTSLRRDNYPEGYQVLCINCNWIKREDNRTQHALDCIKHYSNNSMTCAGCNTSDIRVLTIDHINGGGMRHIREMMERGEGSSLGWWLRKNGYPSGFQVLCMNCQLIKRSKDNEKRRNT